MGLLQKPQLNVDGNSRNERRGNFSNHMFWLHQLINHLQNLQSEDLTYNTSWRKCKEVKEVSKEVAEKAFELVIPFLEEWRE